MDGRSGPASRVLRRRHGPGGHRPHARRVRRPYRRLDLSRLRTRRSRSAAGIDCGRHPRAAARVGERDARDRLPVRLGRRSAHVPRALPARSQPRRPHGGSPPARLGRRPGRDGFGGSGQLALRRPRGSLDGVGLRARGRRDRLGQPSGRSSNGRRRVPRARAPGRTLAEARRRRRRPLGGTARRSRLSPARRARQRRGRDRLGARGPRARGHRHDGEPGGRTRSARRASGRGAPRQARRRSGTRAGRTRADACAPSPRGTGAPRGSQPSRPGSPAGPAGLPAGSPGPDLRRT